jgi:rhamnogalacturonan endolyase
MGDFIGGWREELITAVRGEMRIYSTTIPATNRRVCLMQDPLYRMDVVMQTMGYFYPPQLSTSLGVGGN